MTRRSVISGTRCCRCACGCRRPATSQLCGGCIGGDHILGKRCQNCDTLLTGRQMRWCSNECNEVWHNPRARISSLVGRQAGLCGICALPLDEMVVSADSWERLNPEIEVDHVHPKLLGGSNHCTNLRATHRDCNRTKGALPLDEARRQIGAYDDIIIRRLIRAWAPPTAWRSILPPVIGNTPAVYCGPHPASSQWPYSGHPYEQTVLELGA